MLNGKKIFITGGAGFIGSTLAKRLVENNKIILYDNLSRNAIRNDEILNHPNLTFIEGDILDFENLTKSMKNAEIIVHCAAIAGIDTVVLKPVNTMEVNMVGSANVLKAAKDLPECERVVCFSTSEVFGSYAFNSSENDNTVIGEIGEARWTYAVSKLAIEHLAMAYYNEFDLPVTVLRPFNVYGPAQVGEGALSTFIKKAINNETISIHGDGTQIRAWCYIDDMVDGICLAITEKSAVGESFNIGNQRTTITIYGLANTVVRVLNSGSRIIFTEKNYADVELRIPAIQKAKELLGFEAKIDLEEGIKRTAEYYREKQYDFAIKN